MKKETFFPFLFPFCYFSKDQFMLMWRLIYTTSFLQSFYLFIFSDLLEWSLFGTVSAYEKKMGLLLSFNFFLYFDKSDVENKNLCELELNSNSIYFNAYENKIDDS